MTHYIVETRIGYDWENVWEDDGEPTTFPTRAQADQAVIDLLEEMPDYDQQDYRVKKVNHELLRLSV